MDLLSCTDVGRISGVVKEAENSDHEESSDGGVQKFDVVFCVAVSFVWGEEDSRLCFCFLMLRKKWGGNMYRICHARQRPNAI